MQSEPKPKVWPFNGYAPGNYYCKCLTCQEQFTGDKRAFACLECAVIASRSIPSPISADAVVEACAKIKAVKEYAEHVALGLACGMNVTAATKALIGFCRALKDTLPVVDGWKLVPVEPTQGMIDEACRTAPHVILTYTKPEERDGSVPLIPIATWRAMIAAAPSALVDPEGGV